MACNYGPKRYVSSASQRNASSVECSAVFRYFFFTFRSFGLNLQFINKQNETKMSIDLEKLEEIKDFINNDHLATDIKLSIFTSAASCFKQDSLLSPFPKKYLDGNGIKEFERLVSDSSS
jgi:ARTD15 N-terminal domain